ncbi:sulfite exporter TauE/SafE family protein [Yoonia sp.]|uniref:sulfite exporter TauE/SafE family protein n=1 Tax=Yoonia sp. TaxID=2212373 RepID=UPI0025CE6299|nr:sulfite exporter TauE/SafE family protein [Yoonia sp.]
MDDVMLLATMAGILLVLGAFAGVLAGLLGVGGGIILVPAFFYVFSALGYDSPQLMQICLGTSLATIIVTSLRSVLAHNKKGAVDWEILKTWVVGIAIGAALGVAVASTLRSDVLQAIFGGLAICVGLYMALGSAEWRLGPQMPGGVLRAVLSPVLGFLSVLMGIGGGSFGVPTMTLFGMPIHRAVATAAGFGVIIAVPSVIGFLLVDIDVAPPFTVGAVNFLAFGLIVSMTMITAPWGAALAHRMNAGPLKRLFGVFLILVAVNMIRKALGW